MNTLHEINMMASRGDHHGALSLIRGWSPENHEKGRLQRA